MSNRNLELKRVTGGIDYHPMRYGKRAGQPTVSVKLSSSENNSIKVTSLESQFTRYNWKRKINSGYARLRIHGDNPFADHHMEALNFFFETLDPRFVDIEIEASNLTQSPPRVIGRKADTITVVFDENDDELVANEEALREIAERGRKYGDTQFIYKASSTVVEDDIDEFSREYKVYDSDIWVYPKGRKVKTASENLQALKSVSKRNTWNLSPRMDLLESYDEEE